MKLIRNKKILRVDIYEQRLKPFFNRGDTHVAFYKHYFGENLKENRLIEKREREQEDKVKRDCCVMYIIIEPRKARGYSLWQFVFTIAILVELFLAPFTAVPRRLLREAVGGRGNSKWVDLLH